MPETRPPRDRGGAPVDTRDTFTALRSLRALSTPARRAASHPSVGPADRVTVDTALWTVQDALTRRRWAPIPPDPAAAPRPGVYTDDTAADPSLIAATLPDGDEDALLTWAAAVLVPWAARYARADHTCTDACSDAVTALAHSGWLPRPLSAS